MMAAGVLFLSSLVACSTTQYQKLEKDTFYRRDLSITVNKKSFVGVVVIPKAESYAIDIKAVSDIDMALWRSCAREDSGNPEKPGWFIFKGSKDFNYQYTPNPGLEDTGTCPLRIDTFEKKNNQHAWAFLEFEHPDYVVSFEADCNGRRQTFNGVGACQHKAGLITRIHSDVELMFAPADPKSCPEVRRDATVKSGKYVYRWEMGVGECLYHFKDVRNRRGKHIGIGYQGVLVRGGV